MRPRFKPQGKKGSTQSSNPFQNKWAKSNQSLIRKRAQSVALAKQSGRNSFRDRRIGENNPNLDDENRYLFRLQRERAKKVRKRVRFSLNDDDAAVDEPLGGAAEFPSAPSEDDELLSDEDGEDSGQDSDGDDDLMQLKQPGTDGDEERGERSRQEIMNEVVLKSKMYKAQRQHDKSVADEQITKLDEGLLELMPLLAQSAADYEKRKPKPSLSLKLRPTVKPIFSGDEKNSTQSTATKSFHYESVYRELASEKRARPSERLLTEEEKAERERDRLIELEKERRSRMQSMGDSDGELDADNNASRGRKRKRERGGDDLDTDFDIAQSDDESDSDEAEGTSEADNSDNEVEEGTKKPRSSVRKETPETFWQAIDRESLAASGTGTTEDIPFTFQKCPASAVELQQLMIGLTVEQRDLVLGRIQKCFAESLNPGRNRPKLERLLECILFRIERLAELEGKSVRLGTSEIDKLLEHAYKLGQKFEGVVSKWSRSILVDMRNKLGASDIRLSSAWMTSDIIVARAIGRLYPSSDMRHPITTPLALVLSEAISMGRISSIKDVAMAMFVSSVLLEVMLGREGYSGELGKFVYEAISALCQESNDSKPCKLGSIFKGIREGENETDMTDSPLSMEDYQAVRRKQGTGKNESFVRKVAYAVTGLVEAMNFSGQQRNWDIMLSGLVIESVAIPETRERILKMITQSRVERDPLSLYTKSRKPIVRSLNPKFTAESGVYRKRPKTSYHAKMQGDMTASAKRVQRALRKEERGLARDVRRESQIVAATRARDLQIKNEDRDSRSREVMSFLERQQATWKAAEKRQKKLSGKKW